MISIVPVAAKEDDKIATQNEYHNLDILPVVDVNDICRIASEICNTPIFLACIIDANRQWLHCLNVQDNIDIPCDFPFNENGIAHPGDIFIVPDLTKDHRFSHHSYVTGQPHAVFYAGVLLVNSEGAILATLCLLDTQSHLLEDQQVEALKALARQVSSLFELSEKADQLKNKQAELAMAYADLAKIATIASHDLKSPLNNIISLTHLLKEDYAAKLDEEGNEYINFLNDAAYHLSDLVSGILSYSRSSQLLVEHKEDIDIPALMVEIMGLLNIPAQMVIKYPKEGSIYTSRVALKQILLHLLHNSIRYNDKNKMEIEVLFSEDNAAYYFEIKDNGPGIAEEDKERIFELFEKLHGKKKDGESMGIGLAIVKRLIQKLAGEIKVTSELDKGEGASFLFTLPK